MLPKLNHMNQICDMKSKGLPTPADGARLVAAMVVVICVFCSSVVKAGAPINEKSPAFEECARGAHGVTWPLLRCYSKEMQAADDALSTAYAEALANTRDPKTRDYLAKSQASWADLLHTWCEAVVPRSGSLARFKLFECRLSETRARTKALAANFGR